MENTGQACPEPLTLVLLGHTGVGKSAVGNTILQCDAFESQPLFESLTTEISEQSGSVGGQEVRVVDTPGIMNAQEEVRAFCQELRRSKRPHVFLFVLKIDRFTAEQEAALRSAMGAVGEEGQSRGLLLFTGADSLIKKGLTLDQFIHENPQNPLVSLVQEFGDRVHALNNPVRPGETNQEQVLELMKKINLIASENLESPRRLEEVRLVLMGRPGAGKSSTGNTILGSDVFDADCDFGPVTSETVAKSAEVLGRKVTVVDTPGFNPKYLTVQEYFKQLVWSVIDTNPGPHAFVLVVPIDRISDVDLTFFKLLSMVFDKDLKYSTVVFTHGDRLKKKSIEKLIAADSTVRELVSRCRGRYTVFNNNLSKNRSQVQNLLRHVDEIHSEDEERPYTLQMLFSNNNLILDTPVSPASPRDLELGPSDLEDDQDLTDPPTPPVYEGLIDSTQGPNDPGESSTFQAGTDPASAGENPFRALWRKVKQLFIRFWNWLCSCRSQ